MSSLVHRSGANKPGEWNASSFGMRLDVDDPAAKSAKNKGKGNHKTVEELKEEAGAKRQQQISTYLKTAQQVRTHINFCWLCYLLLYYSRF